MKPVLTAEAVARLPRCGSFSARCPECLIDETLRAALQALREVQPVAYGEEGRWALRHASILTLARETTS